MKKIKRFLGICAVVFTLIAVAVPVQAGHPLVVWTGSDDLGGGAVVLMDFDSSVFTLVDVAQIKALLDSASGSVGEVTDFVYTFGPAELGVGKAADWNTWLLANYQSPPLSTDAYTYLQIGQSVNQFGTNYDVMVFLTAEEVQMTNAFVLGLQMPVSLVDSLLGLLAGLIGGVL